MAAPTVAAPVEVRFTGVLEATGPSAWQLSGQVVRLTSATEIRDNPQVGQTVEVRALRAADGTLTALRIEPEDDGPSAANTPEPGDDGGNSGGQSGGDEQRWEGPLDAINGSTWIIAGQAVTVNGSTEIRDNPQVGDNVEVRRRAGGWEFGGVTNRKA